MEPAESDDEVHDSPDGSGIYACAPRDVIQDCHDVLSALAVIVVNVERLGEQLASDPESTEAAGEASQCANRIAQIVRGIQDDARTANPDGTPRRTTTR
jgi:hypothetical protein